VTTGKQLSGYVDRAVLAHHESDGSSIPVRNLLETVKLYDLIEEHGLEGGLGRRGLKLSRCGRKRYFNT
jgi:hypothetical protein